MSGAAQGEGRSWNPAIMLDPNPYLRAAEPQSKLRYFAGTGLSMAKGVNILLPLGELQLLPLSLPPSQ